MKKASLTILLFCALSIGASSQSIYSIPLRNIDGDSVQLSDFSGKKMLFIILPLAGQDSVAGQLISFAEQHGDSITVIGVISVEDGYTGEMKETVKTLYSGTSIILTEPMNIRKASSNQSGLMQWFTDKNKNRHFIRDADAIGMKFFVGETGRLFAVLGRGGGLQSPIIERILGNTPEN
mgnify:CR=1 FL=1